VEALPAPPTARDRTYVSALVVREWARRQPGTIDAIDLYTESVHARRSALVFRMALEPGITVGVIAATSADFDPRRWWTSSSGTKAVLGEALSLAWDPVLLLAETRRRCSVGAGRAVKLAGSASPGS
jgi:hypothetical protein